LLSALRRPPPSPLSQQQQQQQQKSMRAAVFYGPNKIAVEDIKFNHDCDSDEEGKILLKVNACAVCGYDVRVFRNGHKKVIPPIILGHELCGEIQKTVIATTTMMTNNKEKEITIKKGTRVAVSPILPCLNCRYCQNQLYNLCVNLREIGSTIDGGFAEYVKIPKKILQIGGLVPVPDNLSNEEAALLEPLACCLNGFFHIGGSSSTAVIKERSVVIIGDGPIGLLHLQLSKLYGAAKTIMVGKIPARIQKAKAMGADRTVFVTNDSEEEQQDKNLYNILDFTDGIGADIVIVATSNPKALDFAMKVAGKNSKINVFAGMSSPNQANNNNDISLDPNWLHYNQISITGSFSSTPSMLREAARLASDREIDLSKVISHQYSLTNIEEAILATEKYYGLRVIINKF
jgi:L-iditol 2-dehydrogenase